MNEMHIAPYEHKVQYYETDQMGVVHHSNYIRWFEEGRTYFFEEIGFGYDRMEEEGIISPVLEVNAKYRSMTHYADVVLIETRFTAYNGIKMTIEYTIRDKETGEIRCTGESKHCFLDKNGKFVRLMNASPKIHQICQNLLEKQEE